MTKEDIQKIAQEALKDAERHGFVNDDLGRVMMEAACEVAEAIKSFKNGDIADKTNFDMSVSYLRCCSMSKTVYNAAFYQQYQDKCKDTLQDELADITIFLIEAIVRFEIEEPKEYNVEVDADFFKLAEKLFKGIVNYKDNYYGNAYGLIGSIEQWLKSEQNEEISYWVENKVKFNKLRPYKHVSHTKIK